jgi:O-antigen ligase
VCSLGGLDHLPVAVVGFFVSLAIVATWRPDVGLALTAILVPVASWFGRTWDGALAWPEAVTVAFLLGYTIRQAFQSEREPADNLTVAIPVAIAVVAASAGVHWLVLFETTGGEAFRAMLRDLAGGAYFAGNSGDGSLDAAMRLVEGLLLAHAGASVVGRNAAVARQLIASFVIGAAAAGALNVWRLWLGALRLDAPVATFLNYLVTLRYNAHYGDVNAAGSYFVMALLPALAFARTVSLWRWIAPVALILIALSLSGSRAALLGGVLGAGIVWLVDRSLQHRTRQPSRRRTAALIGVVSASTALRIRMEFARVSVDMLRSRPLFGVGVGEFPERLPDFSTPTLKQLYPVEHENAHNNFLQLLAELGLVGIAAILATLGIAASRMAALFRSPGATLIERASCAGLLAFVLTWISGHPLLVDPPALTFWTLLGVVAGTGAAHTPAATAPSSSHESAGRLRYQWASAGVVLAVLASVAPRAQHELRSGHFEHLGIGVSATWRHDDQISYRTAGRTFELFLQSGRAVFLPIRVTVDAPRVQLEIHLQNRLVDRVELPPDEWQRIRIILPASDRVFERVHFTVVEPVEVGDEDVRVGKAQAVGQVF